MDRKNSVLRINPFGGSTFYLDRTEVCVECGPDERGEFPRSRAVEVIRTELFLRFRKSLREVFFPLVALFGGERVVRRDRTVLQNRVANLLTLLNGKVVTWIRRTGII